MTEQEKRKKIEKLVLDVMKVLDTKDSGNYERYDAMFKSMSDKEFAEWAGSMGKTLDSAPQVFEMPFNEVKIQNIKKAADILNLPLEEYVYFRDKGSEPVRTRYKVPVGWIPIKRLQQMLSKKNHITTDAEKRALKSGQVTGESKVVSISDAEVYGMLSTNANRILEEIYGPRADGYDKKTDFYSQISSDGYVDLDKLETDLTKHTALNTLNTYLLASGLRSDLVVDSLKTAYTLETDLNNKK